MTNEQIDVVAAEVMRYLKLGGVAFGHIVIGMRQVRDMEREACALIVEAEGECRHVDHVQGFCACKSKADAIRARST